MRSASVGHQCPECVAEGRRAQRPTRTAFGGGVAGRRGYVTMTLIAINVLMLLISLASAKNGPQALGGQGFAGLIGGDTPLLDKLGVIGEFKVGQNGPVFPFGISDGQYYRLFTAMFMHFGILHLLLNMYALWVLGRTLESFLGPLRFLGLYLVAGIGGDVAAYLFQPADLSAGASTALFGMFAALFLVLRKLGLNATAVLPIILINLLFTLSVPGISIAGHLGGFVTGAVVGAGLAYAPRKNRGLIQIAVIVGAVVVLGGLSLWQTTQITG
ncbi:rhomboid family intramembrane serine protease [Rugosimonospora acidiphila]|uniref:Rhomboid family intramembrane serine protease n=2 Tax=Rugosimonospora acidiphila TaxID=556531 RepID=A0ABP9RYS9_9ACTN